MSLLKVDIFIYILSVHRSSRNPTISTSKKEKQTKEEKEEKEGRWEGRRKEREGWREERFAQTTKKSGDKTRDFRYSRIHRLRHCQWGSTLRLQLWIQALESLAAQDSHSRPKSAGKIPRRSSLVQTGHTTHSWTENHWREGKWNTKRPYAS